jgi:hypothetical protein
MSETSAAPAADTFDLTIEAEEVKTIRVSLPGGVVHFPLPSEFTLEQAGLMASGEVPAILGVLEECLPVEEYALVRKLKGSHLVRIIEASQAAEGVSPGESSSSGPS